MSMISLAELFASYPDSCLHRQVRTRSGECLDVVYRLANLEEVDELYEMALAAKSHLVEQGIMQWTEHYPLRSHFAGDVERQAQCVGLVDGEIVFSYVLNDDCLPDYVVGQWLDGSVPYLVMHRLCVAPRIQHQGLGKQVFAHLMEQAQMMGYGAMRLDVYDGNAQANAMYLKAGFAKVGDFEMAIGTINLMEKYFIK